MDYLNTFKQPVTEIKVEKTGIRTYHISYKCGEQTREIDALSRKHMLDTLKELNTWIQ